MLVTWSRYLDQTLGLQNRKTTRSKSIYIKEDDIPKKGEFIGKLQDIVIELNNSLDFDVGGDLAGELSSLYDYMLYASTQANINKDYKQLEAVLKVLNTLYDGWMEAVKSLKTEQPQDKKPSIDIKSSPEK